MEVRIMYLPYLRGRQYELLALQELAVHKLIGEHIIPIIEPVKLSSTLVNTMTDFINGEYPIAVIQNPRVGTFISDMQSIKSEPKAFDYKHRFLVQNQNPIIIKAIIMQQDITTVLKRLKSGDIDQKISLIINTDRDCLPLYETLFGEDSSRFILIPDESVFRRRIHSNRVMLDDKFTKQPRNADYGHIEDEFFSDDHLYYVDDGFIGFSDYSIVGNDYIESGFAPHAVAIHMVYFAAHKTLRIRHFVSESNDDIYNPGLKFYEAVSKLAAWYEENKNNVKKTLGLEMFLQHYKNQTYPGLGTIKKLSIMHHIELMNNYFNEV